MIRRIIQIEEESCNGCGICVDACHEGAIHIIEGKAKLMRDDYCDGLGDCLPTCPTGAISFVEREAAAYDEAAVEHNKKKAEIMAKVAFAGCPGSRSMQFEPKDQAVSAPLESQLRQWPVQIKLVPVKAPYFDQADLLIAADCCAYAYGDFHQKFLKDKVVVVGCPKLDQVDYSEKLAEIIKNNSIHSVTITRMEVPCCGGLEHAALKALEESGKEIPCQVVTISVDGKILS